MIIGLTGKARSGKGEIASHLALCHKFHEDSFAAPIRRFMMDILNIQSMNEYHALKEVPNPIFGGKTLREALQTCGTEWGRNMIYEEMWIESLKKRVSNSSKHSNIVISDIRFNNEAQAVLDLGGKIVQVIRPSVSINYGRNHESEDVIDPEFVSHIITNKHSIECLHNQIEDYVELMELFASEV